MKMWGGNLFYLRNELHIFVLINIFPLIFSRHYLKDPEICGRPQCPVNQKFNYNTHIKYIYNYNVMIQSMFDGAGTDSADLNIKSIFNLLFLSTCEGILQIMDASFGNDTIPNRSAQQLKEALTKFPLRFSFDNGKISQICPKDEEEIWVLNIKKGILSALQNGMMRFDVDQHFWERDVNGDCGTSYYFKQVNKTTLVIEKKKDLSTCTHRYQLYSIIPTAPYVSQKRYHKWTPMNSTIICSQHIDHKIYTKIVCREDHAYQPFYNQTNGAKTRSIQEITLVSEDRTLLHNLNTRKKDIIMIRDSLLFDHRKPPRATHEDLFECKELLTAMCFLTKDSFHPEFPDVFNRFIHIARDISTPALNTLYQESSTICSNAKKHILDALPYIRSRASTYVMTEVILKKEIPPEIIQEWLFIMTFFPRPDAETIDSVARLLLEQEPDLETLLGVSSMVRAYCENNHDCKTRPSVMNILDVIETTFSSSCVDLRNQSKAIGGLKAVGNLGIATPSLVGNLKKCIENEGLTIQLRIAAVESHRRLPCESNQHSLVNLLKNNSNSQEIRIASYLQIMKCPTYLILRTVKHILDTEEYNQVGSFIWSHLQNQKKSSMPSKIELQSMLQDENLHDKFKKDFRKFSKNYETSFYLNSYGVGGFMESNVIFSEKSFIPRSIMTNFTVNLFGESINVLEIEVYLEGLEQHLEDWFKKGEKLARKTFYNVMKNVRILRDAPNYLKHVVDSIPFDKIIGSDFKASLSVKIFGNEVKYYTIKGDTELKNVLNSMNPLKIVEDFLSGQEVEFERSTMLTDMSYTTPMTIGIPLRINLVGTAAINLNASGFVDLSKFTANSQLEMDGKLRPSIGVHFEGSMLVDTFVIETGVKFKGNVFTSSALEGNVSINGFEYVGLSFNLPMKKSDIFHAETQLLLIKGQEEISIEGITAGRVENNICTWSVMDEVIGLKFCTTSLLPNTTYLRKSPLFLFSGPLKFGISLEKSDPTAQKYNIEYKVDKNTTTNKTIITFKFETPHSTSRRGMKAVIDLDTQSQNLTLAYQSALSQVQAQGFYRNTPTEKYINFGLDINGKKHIDIQVGVNIKQGKYGNTYSPKLLFAINNKKIVELTGSIKWVEKNGVSQCDIDLDFKTNKFATIIAGYVRKNDVSIALNIKMDYKLGNARQETARIELKLGDRSSKFLSQLYGNLQIESTAYPQINLITSLKYQSTQGHVECKVDMQTNPYVTDDRQKLHVQWAFQHLKNFQGNEVLNTSLEVTKPSSDIDIRIGLVQKEETRDIPRTSTIFTAKYATGKEIVVRLDLILPHSNMFLFETTFSISLNGPHNQMLIFTRIAEKTAQEYEIDFTGTWFSGHNITIKGMYQDRSKMMLTSRSLKLVARSELFKDILFIGRYMISEEEYKLDLQAEHESIRYGILVRHISKSPNLYENYAEVRYNKTTYSITNHIDLIKRETILEFHLDRFRDIHIALRGLSNKNLLDAGFDLKWDANRDPSQKLIVILSTNLHGNFNYDGKAIFEYPGSVMTANYLIEHIGKDYKLSTNVEWSPKDSVSLFLQGMYDLSDNGIVKVVGRLSTPFAEWQYTALNYELNIIDRGIKSLGSVSWVRNKKLNFELYINYLFSEDVVNINFISMLNSSIPEINTMHAILKHHQMENEYESELGVQLSPIHLIVLSSSGKITYEVEVSKYVWNIGIKSPFSLIERGSLSADLNILPHRKFRGNLNLIGNGKKYATTVEGSIKTLNESKVTFHIATPIEKYKLIHGKFGYSATNKHIIAEVKGPITSGIEILYAYQNISYFDLKLRVHTSVTFLNSLLLVGKIKSEIIDLRCGWNTLLVGLIGSSHYKSWKDVDYSLQLFTPVEGFHTCSAIAKFIYADRIDFEASVKVAEKKVGLVVQAMSKPDDDFALPTSPTVKFIGNHSTNVTVVAIPQVEFDEPEYGDVFWRGALRLHSLFYPTVHMYAQINEDGFEYYMSSHLTFPFGQLKFRDTFEFIDILHIKNNLNLSTTCDCLTELLSEFSLEGNLRKELSTKLQVKKTSYNDTILGFLVLDYDFMPLATDDDDSLEGIYNIYFNMKTPFPKISYCRANITLSAESHSYETNLSVVVNNSTIDANGTVELDTDFLDSDIGIKFNSSFFLLPMSRLLLRKDFTNFEKKMEVILALPNEKGDRLVNYGVGGTWFYESPHYMKYLGQIITPYTNIGIIKGSFELKNEPSSDNYYISTMMKYAQSKELKIDTKIHANNLVLQLESTFESFRNIIINSTIVKSGPNLHTLEAVVITNDNQRMNGWATFSSSQPMVVEIKLLNEKHTSEILNLVMSINKKEDGLNLDVLLQHRGEIVNVHGDYVNIKNLGKKLDLLITSSYPGYESLNIDGLLLSEDNKAILSSLTANVKSKWATTAVQVDINLLLEETCGVMEINLNSSLVNGNAQIVWLSIFIEQLLLDVKGAYSYSDIEKSMTSIFHFWNIEEQFTKMSIGGEINFNQQEWWFCSNTTLLYPNWNNFAFVSNLLLPHIKEELHSLYATFNYGEDLSSISHVLKYSSAPGKFEFKTLSEITLAPELSKGAILLETGKHRVFDKFIAEPVGTKLVLENLLQSTNMNEDLSVKMEYEKPKSNHYVMVEMCYPPNYNIMTAYVDFNTVSNMFAKMNCSTPFVAFPKVQLLLEVITNKTMYLRYGEVKWSNNSAIFNYTHASKLIKDIQITEGNILADFPLTTRHIGELNYNYESTPSLATGQSHLKYNGDPIMGGNYSRKTECTDLNCKEDINIKINNSFMPIGINYFKQLNNHTQPSANPFKDLKRIEIFKLNDKKYLNLTGEMEIIKHQADKHIKLKAMHSQRKLSIEHTYEGENKQMSRINFTVKPDAWIGYSLILVNKAGIHGQKLEFNVSYPRRLFTVLGEYDWNDNEFSSDVTIFPNQFRRAKFIGGNVHWKQISNKPKHYVASATLSHPSFDKNLTLQGVYIRKPKAPFQIDVEFEYSKSKNKKVWVNAIMERKLSPKISLYLVNATGSHPASRLKLMMVGGIKFSEGIVHMFQNVSYKRSYLPFQFWITDVEIDATKNLLRLEKKSLRDSGYLFATYGKVGHKFLGNGIVEYGNDLNVSGDFILDTEKSKTHLLLNFTPDASEQLYMDGAYMDHRHAVFDIWRMYDGLRMSDFSFYAHLNHSRMLNSKFFWRPNIHSEIMGIAQNTSNKIWIYILETVNFWTQYIKSEVGESVSDIWFDAKPIIQDFITDVRNVEYLEEDIRQFKKFFNESYHSNEFYMQDIYGIYLLLAEEISFRDKMGHVPKIVNELWEVMGETGETVRQSILWVVESAKQFYEKLVEFYRALISGETINQMSQFLQKLAGKYDKMIKDIHISFLNYMEYLWNEGSTMLSEYWTKCLRKIEPTFIRIAHYVESMFWEGSRKVLKFLYDRQTEILNSTVFIQNSNLTEDLDKFYKDLTKNDFATNLNKYSTMFIHVIKEKYFNFVPFGYELNEIGTEIVGEVKELYKLSLVNFTIETSKEIYSKVLWVYNYLNMGEKLQRILPFIIQIIDDLSHTALENEMINHEGRTKFVFDPDNGIVKFEQKLPMPWHAFNETPNFEEIPEYKLFTNVQKMLAPSNNTFWTYYYKYSPLLDPATWLPPFKAQAIISGGQHFVTFDKRHYEYKSHCSYLLAKDFVSNTFSLLFKYEHGSHHIVLLVDDNVITMDLLNNEVRVEQQQRVRILPLQLGKTQIYREEGIAVIKDERGFTLNCNLKYDVCIFSLSGWYFGKTAGMLGTMDNEPYNDFLTSYGTNENNIQKFVQSWTLGSCINTDISSKKPLNAENLEKCNALFHSITSSFISCFSVVDPMPFNLMCQRNLPGIDNEICSSAFAYVKACEYEHTPLRVPPFCPKCSINNETLEEGDLTESDLVVQNSSDIVFIIEAKECNQYIRERRGMNLFLTVLSNELNEIHITDNRYGIVVFGGDGVFDEPRSTYINNQFFTTDKNIPHIFEYLPSGNGSSDIFGALKFSSQLNFRAGASKTFILIPCSECDLTKMTVDYSVLNPLLIEKDITLHILMNAEFDLEKLRISKTFYGLDSRKAYTKNDVKNFRGDEDLRRQIKLTRTVLGYCIPLALETNGTIFTGKKMRNDNASMKKFSTVFARRIAITARPDPCQSCECVANSNGIQFLECLPCSFPTPATSEFDFKDNTTVALFQAFDGLSDGDFNF